MGPLEGKLPWSPGPAGESAAPWQELARQGAKRWSTTGPARLRGTGGSEVQKVARQYQCGPTSRFRAGSGVGGDGLSTFGSINILVNNAGATRDMLLMQMKEPDWDAVLPQT